MNRNLLARAIAVLILGILFASFIDRDRQKWHREGREAFLAHEGERFDRFISPPRSFSFTALSIGTTVLAFILVGLYEVIVIFASKLLKSVIPDLDKPSGSPGVPFT